MQVQSGRPFPFLLLGLRPTRRLQNHHVTLTREEMPLSRFYSTAIEVLFVLPRRVTERPPAPFQFVLHPALVTSLGFHFLWLSGSDFVGHWARFLFNDAYHSPW
ncbi:unnamed protein product [Vitrella brassicaformis CCMP3155]|uniref:Uncharacterized protein n=1 Tax=Vitrella brassicaformis (strain CCMP3155) TaxID=1169540 RepID=A0A0G4H1G6_VITBC|nr:unnamed protein product [Vitrella brassicaformis CCMP3155]|eukprot:CEM37306.1 unnamed protein product [Vitrella brassicaformis CCMP3155]